MRAFTLFATHYFELTTLPETHDTCANVHLDAVEHGDHIVFMYAVKDGPASQSYGLQVAALAGVPRAVIERAKQKLLELEHHAARPTAPQQQLALFAPANARPALDALEKINPDALTPRQALDALYQLKGLL